MSQVTKIHHIAVAVPDLSAALAFWQDALGLTVDHIEEVPSQDSRVAFLPVGDGEIELVQPLSPDGSLARFVAERGGGLHHICLEVDDIRDALAQLKTRGLRLINEEPLELPGRLAAFVHPKSTGGVLLELYQLLPS